MASNFIETGTVNHNFAGYSYDNVVAELNSDMEETRKKINHIRQMGESASDDETRLMLESEYKSCLETQKLLQDGLDMAREYPEEFPVLYAMIAREDVDESGVSFELNEILAETDDIVTEARDVMPKGKQLELSCTLPDAGTFGIVVTPYDKPGEDSEQLKARITFPDSTIENLNEARLKAIFEFCEKKGLSIYDLTIPYKDGMIDVDEKLAELTRKLLEDRRLEDVQRPGPDAENSNTNDYVMLFPEINDLDLSGLYQAKKKSGKKEVNLDFIRNEITDFIENDLKKTRDRSYFEKSKNIDGLKTYVFSLYDKPNKDNEKLDGVKDKNGNYVPTYSHRLYVAQNPQTGGFVFGYATPGGKKMDDTMAGDFIGIIKKTGATHVRFSNISSADKGVWMMACAEKGLVPIGISINAAKGKAMVEAARKKLSTEEFIEFKYRLSEQLIENAKAKCKDKSDPTYGLDKSELDFISGLKTARNFENFRIAYEDGDGLYAKVMDQIDKGSKDSQKGAAITFGSMKALRTVFDIYFGHQDETLGQRLESCKDKVSREEYAALKAISSDKKLGDLNTEEFMLIYNTILPRHIEESEQDILHAYARELKRTPRRADGVVLASDLFPRAKGAITEINITLTRNGIDTLTLPNEHKGLEFERPAEEDLNARINANNRQNNTSNSNMMPPVNQNVR